MTHCAAMNRGSFDVAADGCCAAAPASERLNGMAPRRTKRMTTELGRDTHPRPRRPWLSIAVALVAVASVLAGELWALHAAPATGSEVVTELNGTLARVVAASVLISPAD